GLWVFNMITTGIVVIICFVGIRLTQKRGKNPDTFIDVRTKTEWKLIPIADCEEPIPAFALQTAIDLKKQFGDKVTFFIEKAEVTREERVIERLDPFLVVSLPDESQYYLEVWNEPGFRGKRMV
ncbi:MAG TPA: hypothetical protein VLG69_00845, partial [Candidatus Andersenbacteria bacterium]|nr:hypothetical protein [Candidatus Andersenbacteria bacterium]